MTGTDSSIRWSTTVAVIGVAAVAAVVSYKHAYALVRAHGETGWTAHLIPLTGAETTIRGTQQTASDVSPETGQAVAGMPHALQARAAEEFAGDVAAGGLPSIRVIRARLHVGQPRAQRVRAYLATLAAG